MNIKKVKNIIIYAYLIVMLGILPLYMRAGYSDIGDRKYNLFFISSAISFGLLLILTTIEIIIFGESTWTLCVKKGRWTELSVYSFFVVVLISFLVSPYKEYSVTGAYDWYMGLVTQVIFFAIYIFLSNDLEYGEWLLYVMYAASAVVFLIGVLNRFDVDIFGVYEGLNEEQKMLFLSTIGQSSWYSGYLCMILPIGIYDFYVSKSKRKLILGFYIVIGFMSLVTQNTDSAYIALLGVMLVLLYKSVKTGEGMIEYAKLIAILSGSFMFVGILQNIFCDKVIMPERVSVMMSQGVLPLLLFIIALVTYVMLRKNILKENCFKYLYWSAVIISLVALILWVAVICLNSTGRINPQIENNYLIWDEAWGNYRGLAWMLALKMYCSIGTPWGYLFGVGPDCYYVYSCCIPQLVDYVDSVIEGIYFANAHNDYLTILVNYGAVGLVTYLAMIVLAVKNFMTGQNKLLYGIAMCIVAYSLHNMFCYQEVCNAPFFYIMLGIGNNLIKNEEK